MRNKPIQADQLIPTSSTPPPEAGFYRIDRQTIGVVGNMSFRDPNTQAMMPVGKGAITFTDFAPRLLASLVVSSTAACTSGVVTVTATAHGIPATILDGMEFYYPGSPSLAAGFYRSFSRTGANTVTFSAPLSADFGSESVNAGAIFSSELTMASITIPGGEIVPIDIVLARLYRFCDQVASAKTVKLKVNGTMVSQHSVSTSAASGSCGMAFMSQGVNKQIGVANMDNFLTATTYTATEDSTQPMVLSITAQLAAASQYIAIASAKLRIE